MKRINELEEKREKLFQEAHQMIDTAENENRGLTDDEKTSWDGKVAEIEKIDEEISRLKKQEEMNKRFAKAKSQKSPEEKLAQRFDLFKAIREVARGLSGAEKELVDEGIIEMKRAGVEPMPNSIVIPSGFVGISKRAYVEVGTTDTTPPIKTGAADLLSIVRTPTIMDKMGVTFYTGLTGNFKIPRMGQLSAAFVAEKTAVDTAGVNLESDTLAPRRVGSGDNFTKELFSQTSESIQNQILQDFVDAIFRAIQKDLLDEVALKATSISGYAITDAVAALDHDALLALESAIENDYDGMAYAMSHAQKAKLKALVIGGAGSGRFAWDADNQVNGYNAFATASLAATNGGSTNTAFDVLFGYWKAAVVGLWGGLEIIVDPYTNAKTGEYVITANALADTGVANPLHFAAIRNADA